MIDISDGLSTDLSHLCSESRVGAEIWEDAVPLAHTGRPLNKVDFEFALHGGDDYELLFTASPTRTVPSRIAGVQVTEIGKITRRSGIKLVRANGHRSDLRVRGWEHFRQT
jgi:thiamine-monophosphate kinase